MPSRFPLGKQHDIAEMLRHDHEEIRAQLAKAMSEPGPIAEAAKRVDQLCLPHFELEEQIAFPILARMHDLVLKEDLTEELVEVQRQIADLCHQHKQYGADHYSIDSEVETFLQTAYKESSGEAAELGRIIRRRRTN